MRICDQFNLYCIRTDEPQLTFYGSGKHKLWTLFNALGRLLPPTSLITAHKLVNPLGRHRVPWSTVIYDRSQFTRRRKNAIYNGPEPEELEQLDEMEGRAHLFTPKEKAKTYNRIMECYPYIAGLDIAVLTDYVMLLRSEVPLGRAMAQDAGRLGRPKLPPEKRKQPAVHRYEDGTTRRIPTDDYRYRL